MIITIARKPLEGSVCSNVTTYQCGGLNIDQTRIAHSEVCKEMSAQPKVDSIYQQNGRYQPTLELKPEGRWPANTLLSHQVSCVYLGTSKVKGHQGYSNGPKGKSYHYASDKRGEEVRPKAWKSRATDADGNETITVWDCENTCPVKILDSQSGVTKSPATYTRKADGFNNGVYTEQPCIGEKAGSVSLNFGDQGGASRYFKVFPE